MCLNLETISPFRSSPLCLYSLHQRITPSSSQASKRNEKSVQIPFPLLRHPIHEHRNTSCNHGSLSPLRGSESPLTWGACALPLPLLLPPGSLLLHIHSRASFESRQNSVTFLLSIFQCCLAPYRIKSSSSQSLL